MFQLPGKKEKVHKLQIDGKVVVGDPKKVMEALGHALLW